MVFHDVEENYLLLLGKWDTVPTGIEATDGVFGEGSVNGWQYVITNTAYLDLQTVRGLVPPSHFVHGDFTDIVKEGLRQLAGNKDRGEKKQLEARIIVEAEKIGYQ